MYLNTLIWRNNTYASFCVDCLVKSVRLSTTWMILRHSWVAISNHIRSRSLSRSRNLIFHKQMKIFRKQQWNKDMVTVELIVENHNPAYAMMKVRLCVLLGVIFRPRWTKNSAVCHFCPSTATDKSGKLMLFPSLPTLIHQMETPNDIIIQTKLALTLTLTLTLTLNPNPNPTKP